MSDKQRILELERKVEKMAAQQEVLLSQLEKLMKMIADNVLRREYTVADHMICTCGGKMHRALGTFPHFSHIWECSSCGTTILPS